jgi:hypothetical protein
MRQQRYPPGDDEKPYHPSRAKDLRPARSRLCVGRKSLRARPPSLQQIGEARGRHQVRDRSRDGRRPDDCCRQQHSEADLGLGGIDPASTARLRATPPRQHDAVERQSRRRRGRHRDDSSVSPVQSECRWPRTERAAQRERSPCTRTGRRARPSKSCFPRRR